MNQYQRDRSNSGVVFSICIANYNGEHYLKNCIDSVLGQNVDFTVEIIVHDDASSDASVQLIKKKYPQVILIESRKNVGYCVSNNRMVDQSNGEFILLLNNDAKLRQNALQVLYNAHHQFGQGIYSLPQYNMETGELIDMGTILDPFLNPIPNLDAARDDVGMVTGACMFLTKKLWREIGGFPEHFLMLAEDLYVSCIARIMGYKVKVVSGSAFDHWIGRSIGGGKVKTDNRLETTKRRRILSERNKSFVMLISYPTIGALILIPLHLLILLMEGVVLSMVKRNFSLFSKIYWDCIKQVFGQRKPLLAKRCEVQKSKKISLAVFFEPFSLVPHKFKLFLRHGLPEVR